MASEDFPAKLAATLKSLSISRGRLASELRVDKSVVARWLGGVHAPTDENLANLTALVASRRPRFSLRDWDGDIVSLEAALAGPMSADGPAEWLPPTVLQEALATTAARGEAYEGFWRSTRPFLDSPGRFVHDRILIRRAAHGLLEFRLNVIDMRFRGVAFPSQTQIFSFCADPVTGVFIFTILNGVLRQRADVMDGLSLTVQRAGGGSPVATGVLLERTGLLSHDPVADDARYEAESKRNQLAPEGSIPPETVALLNQTVASPLALAAGAAFLLCMPFDRSVSRGPIDGIPLPS